ncbi:bifunctional UDP-glucose 4-epimerase/aldose 1-epimerase [Sugiyamaella lignohabitans]|uniref:Bifunctional UDP-glucose 4-epimerase/aldose 1-epimerase n=1 Tax=Sugiyamaella lignohabitans TaxID=796027 RepID=A0A167DMS5_9ASCO|nr:bifunctional UDP-glucose 4-epimerase/aldose 1-epimerase [Sugiyamaella lignohabitans]ANB13082.1 bifunctional UDP-glucose 4-epimerase/aldose 1-epimerase [Sugiyamaella lignohabitans]
MTSTHHNTAASITSFKTVDGKETALKFDNLENYKKPNYSFLGATIGRYANRIYGGGIEVLGKKYPLEINNPAAAATLHGGAKGWDKEDWEGPVVSKVTENGVEKTKTVYSLVSPHLDQGFPGKVNAKTIYTSYVIGEKAYLELEYEAELAEDTPVDETVISLTNHNFFNPALKDDTYEGTEIKVFSNQYIVHDAKTFAPTGAIEDFPLIPKDLPFITLKKEGPFIDHCFVVQPQQEFTKLDTRDKTPSLHVHFHHPETKVNVQVLSTEPVFQVYTGDYMNIPKWEGESRAFPTRCGLACEPARFTNAANRPEWRPWVTLKKGDKYGSKIVYVNWVGEKDA